MSAHYEFGVTVIVTDNAKVKSLLRQIGNLAPFGYDIDREPAADHPGCVVVRISGEGTFAAGEVLVFDKLIGRLGQHAVAPTTARYVYEYDEPGCYYVGPESMRVAYTSTRALARIRKMVDRLTPEDVATLRDELAARTTV